MTPFQSPAVQARFDGYPPAVRARLLRVRELVFTVASTHEEVGALEESLKWGEPAYRPRNGAGSTLRMDWKPKAPDHYALYFNCQTDLVDTFRTLFPKDFSFQGSRALLLPLNSAPPLDALRLCVQATLTYHATRRAGAAPRR